MSLHLFMKIRIILKSFNNLLLNDFFFNFKNQVKEFNICNTISFPTKFKKFCVLKSPHIDKNSREEFELRVYKKLIDMEIENENFKILNIQVPKGIFCELYNNN